MRKIELAGAALCLPERAEGDLFTVCVPAGREFARMLEEIWNNLPPLAVLAVPAGSWEALSPFAAPALREGEPDFTPGADAALARAAEAFEQARQGCPLLPRPAFAGYSLAGLTALYGLHAGWGETFSAFASLSGSLWMEGWAGFADSHPAPPDGRAYLSLGGKEEKAGSPRMRRVGEETRAEVDRLKMQLSRENLHFTLHPGGHAANVPGRWTAALIWLSAK